MGNDNDVRPGTLVQVEQIGVDGRLISAMSNPAQLLSDRVDDIRRGVQAGAAALGESVSALMPPDGWKMGAVEAKFGVSLGVEGSVILSKATAEATFEVTLRFEPA